MGGLGCPAALALGDELSRRGGLLVFSDGDIVDLSNLHRQILYRTADVGRRKAEVAAVRLADRFARLELRALPFAVDASIAAELFAEVDVVLDGTDSLDTKFLLSDIAVATGTPLVHGAAVRLGGQLMSIVPGSACLRCVFESPNAEAASCSADGVLGPVAGVIGARMAIEALAILEGRPALAGALSIFDGAHPALDRRVAFSVRATCKTCHSSLSTDSTGAQLL